jgi:hypothetical protein
VHELVVFDRRDLRDERALCAEAVHVRVRMPRDNGLRSVEADGGHARVRAGQLRDGWLHVPGWISLHDERERRCAWLQRYLLR